VGDASNESAPPAGLSRPRVKYTLVTTGMLSLTGIIAGSPGRKPVCPARSGKLLAPCQPKPRFNLAQLTAMEIRHLSLEGLSRTLEQCRRPCRQERTAQGAPGRRFSRSTARAAARV